MILDTTTDDAEVMPAQLHAVPPTQTETADQLDYAEAPNPKIDPDELEELNGISERGKQLGLQLAQTERAKRPYERAIAELHNALDKFDEDYQAFMTRMQRKYRIAQNSRVNLISGEIEPLR